MNKPIIMTAQLGASDFAWADRLRRQYYPPDRNMVPAHITLFHHLPPQALEETRKLVKDITRLNRAPKAEIRRLISLGKGVAYQISSPELLDIRMDMTECLHGLLSIQDQQTPRFHLTLQNKVPSKVAKETLAELARDFESRPIQIKGIELHYYVDGPWENIGSWSFRG